MIKTKAQWRGMQKSDLAGVCRVAAICHPQFPETAEVLAEKQRLAPDLCFVLADGGRNIVGYLLAHPWRQGHIPALDRFLGQIPQNADVVYVHDLALLPQTRGGGYAGAVLAMLESRAQEAGYDAMALVAVNHSAAFWRGQGFSAIAPTPAMAEKLKAYSDDALYMMKENLSAA